MVIRLIRLLFSPAHCSACKRLLEKHVLLCTECTDLMHPIVSTQVAVTATKNVSVFALSAYTDPLMKLIRAKNYHDYMAAVTLGRLLAEYLEKNTVEFDCIVPVPLHWSRRIWRGFNQTEVMAQEIAHMTKKPVVFAVKRVRRTMLQATLSRTKRFENVSHSFALSKNSETIRNKKILIVDDLMTSGATIRAVSHALLKAHPHKIIALVAARVIH